ncbi:tRNA (adenosine(37)-N6)-threonylcarbamoyltransferase complex transferase subunit TsaD [Candidatus Dependentiae bacterium]|nr:tRNA (adenosine(37)-N6)-threonylcarbamoyltransferase complex transferase subunit TsaD [Candidatus Dependentiae bacterium]
MKNKLLAIESSCDETAASIYDMQKGVLSNVYFSQIDIHSKFGGVVPELASRSHLEKINFIVEQALLNANTKLNEIDAVAVTNKPGLPGSLLIGLSFAKAIAWSLNKKIIGVNHLEGHIFSSCIENKVPFPHLCLTASGGHTAMYLVEDFGKFTLLGQTLDDAAGEAFDKIAKLMNLPYPGGPVIEKLAEQVNFEDFFHYPRLSHKNLDFSFSGIKTAVLYDLVNRGAYNLQEKKFLKDNDEILKQKVASSLLVAVADIFIDRIKLALKDKPEIKALTFVGGVACNKYIKNRFSEFAKSKNLQFFYPSPQYCTDNAAMIAFVGNYKLQKNQIDNLELDIY